MRYYKHVDCKINWISIQTPTEVQGSSMTIISYTNPWLAMSFSCGRVGLSSKWQIVKKKKIKKKKSMTNQWLCQPGNNGLHALKNHQHWNMNGLRVIKGLAQLNNIIALKMTQTCTWSWSCFRYSIASSSIDALSVCHERRTKSFKTKSNYSMW